MADNNRFVVLAVEGGARNHPNFLEYLTSGDAVDRCTAFDVGVPIPTPPYLCPLCVELGEQTFLGRWTKLYCDRHKSAPGAIVCTEGWLNDPKPERVWIVCRKCVDLSDFDKHRHFIFEPPETCNMCKEFKEFFNTKFAPSIKVRVLSELAHLSQ